MDTQDILLFKKLICIICRTRARTTKCNVFETVVDEVSLHQMYSFVTDLIINKDDSELPNVICKRCSVRLKDAYDLKNEAICSQKYFNEFNDISQNTKLKGDEEHYDNLYNEEEVYSLLIQEPNESDERTDREPTESYKLLNFEHNQDEFKNPILEFTSIIVENESDTDTSQSRSETLDGVQLILKEFEKRKIDVKTSQKATIEKNFLCAICQMKFSKKSNLVDHLRYHAEVKPFKCTYCPKSFVQVGNLRAHERIHTKEKPYKCHLCPKSYTQSSPLKIHIRSHTNERNYHCGSCFKSFTNSSDLLKHKKLHNPTDQFKCEFCSKMFAQKVNLNLHLKRYHSTLS